MKTQISTEKLPDFCFGDYKNSSQHDESVSPLKTNKDQLAGTNIHKNFPISFESFLKEESEQSTKHSVNNTRYQRESDDFHTSPISFCDKTYQSFTKTKKHCNSEKSIDFEMFHNLEKNKGFDNHGRRKSSYENPTRVSISPLRVYKTQVEDFSSSQQTSSLQEDSPITKSSSLSLNSLELEEIDLIEFDINFTSDELALKSVCGLEDDISTDKDAYLGKRCNDDFTTNFNKNSKNNSVTKSEDDLQGLEMLEQYCKKFVRVC